MRIFSIRVPLDLGLKPNEFIASSTFFLLSMRPISLLTSFRFLAHSNILVQYCCSSWLKVSMDSSDMMLLMVWVKSLTLALDFFWNGRIERLFHRVLDLRCSWPQAPTIDFILFSSLCMRGLFAWSSTTETNCWDFSLTRFRINGRLYRNIVITKSTWKFHCQGFKKESR